MIIEQSLNVFIHAYIISNASNDKTKSMLRRTCYIKFIFSKKATKIDKIFTIDLTFTTYRQINGEDFFSIFAAFLENINFTRIDNK